MPLLDIAMRLGDLLQWKAPIKARFDIASLDQLLMVIKSSALPGANAQMTLRLPALKSTAFEPVVSS